MTLVAYISVLELAGSKGDTRTAQGPRHREGWDLFGDETTDLLADLEVLAH